MFVFFFFSYYNARENHSNYSNWLLVLLLFGYVCIIRTRFWFLSSDPIDVGRSNHVCHGARPNSTSHLNQTHLSGKLKNRSCSALQITCELTVYDLFISNYGSEIGNVCRKDSSTFDFRQLTNLRIYVSSQKLHFIHSVESEKKKCFTRDIVHCDQEDANKEVKIAIC